jgi:solute:Na+ symporter, SSS family
MNIAWLVALYLAFTLVIGLAASRLIHGSADFFSANRRLPFFVSSFALFALWFGSETIFGASSEFLEHGLLGVIEDPFGGFLCLLLFGLLLVRPLYRQNLLTLGDLFRKAYGPRTEYLSAFFMILTFVGYIAGQLIALSLLFSNVFGMDSSYGLLLSTVIVTLYTTGGGMWAVSLTDFLQSLVIIAGLLLLCFFLLQRVEPAALLTPPQPHYFDFFPSTDNGMSWLDYTAAWLTLGLGSLASQDIFQRANAARSENVAVFSTLFGAFLYLIFAMLPLLLALLVHHLDPALAATAGEDVLLKLVAAHAPPWLQAMFFGALISAVFSTCSGALLAPASILAENVVKPLWLRGDDDKQLLLVVRLCVVVMALLALLLSFSGSSIYELVAGSSIVGAVSILVPLLFALFNWRSSALGAGLSMAGGLVGYLLFEYGFTDLAIPSLFLGMGCSLLGMAAGTWLSGRAAQRQSRAGL